MLSTDTHLQMIVHRAPLIHGNAYQPPHAIAVQRLEWIGRQNLHWLIQSRLFETLDIFQQELALGVVAAHAEGRLCQVIGAKAEELCYLCNLPSSQRGARQLDHRTKLIGNLSSHP